MQHFGLRDKPFSLTPHLNYYFSAAHGDAKNDLSYFIEERHGLALLIGEPGTGKTTLLRSLLASLTRRMHGMLLSDVSLLNDSLLKDLAGRLLLPTTNEPPLAAVLSTYFEHAVNIGTTIVVLIDEAQALTRQQLDEVRFLTNLEVRNRKAVQIILAGQPALEKALEAPELEAFKQRVAVRTHLEPFDTATTQAYVEFRFRVAGAVHPHVFTPDALHRVQILSRGLPRWINLICDRALVFGYAEEARILDEKFVNEAAADLKLEPPTEHSVAIVPESPPARSDLTSVTPGLRSSPAIDERLASIETKLDVVVDALKRAGLLQLSGREPHRAADLESQSAKSDSDGTDRPDENTNQRVTGSPVSRWRSPKA